MSTRPIGKRYEGGRHPVIGAEFEAYADATEDPNPAYRGANGVAPPMFHVRLFIGLMLDLAGDPELEIDMLRLVHGEHAMQFLRPLRDGDVLEIEGELLSVSEKSSGTVFDFALRGRVDGELACDGHTAYFIRGSKPPGPKKPRAPAEPGPPPTWSREQPVAEDQATRYAAASHDHNPIHVDPDVAKRAGLPGVILHGLCTLAFAARDLVSREAEGDPNRLRSISARFAAPVFPGETLTLEVNDNQKQITFTTRNARGKPVLVSGSAEVR